MAVDALDAALRRGKCDLGSLDLYVFLLTAAHRLDRELDLGAHLALDLGRGDLGRKPAEALAVRGENHVTHFDAGAFGGRVGKDGRHLEARRVPP